MPSVASEHLKHPHLDHVFKIGTLMKRVGDKNLSLATRQEAADELTRYTDEGRITHKFGKEEPVAKKTKRTRAVEPEPTTFTGQGIIFAVIDDREQMREGKVTTIDIIADGIEAALDAGHETSEEIARFLTTSAFQHIPDKRLRFNAVLKASDVVGAQMTRKLYNSYNDLAQLADEEEDAKAKADLRLEARGFAAALQIVLSPFSSELASDPRLVDWDEVDRMVEAFEKEQRYVRRDRKGAPQ
jgi:hypothetical protein